MIKVKVGFNGDDIVKVETKGHANYAEEGHDIVCSAVSAIVQTALMGLIDISGPEVEYTQKDGYLCFTTPQKASGEDRVKQQAVLRAMFLGLLDMENGYKAYLKVEVN